MKNIWGLLGRSTPSSGVAPGAATSIWPPCGPSAGSAVPVTLKGSGWSTSLPTSASIGGTNIGSFVLVNDTTITGTAPAGTVGLGDILVTNTHGSGTLTGGFAFLANCILQLHAAVSSSITQSGGTISKWADLSGSGNDWTQGTMANQPAYDATGMNGLPAVFNASPSGVALLQAAGFPTSGAAGHLFGVIKDDPAIPATVQNGFWSFGTGATPFPGGFGSYAGGLTIYENFASTSRYDSGSNNAGGFTVPDLRNPTLQDVRGTSSGWDEYVNGVHAMTSATNTVGWNASPPLFNNGLQSYGWISDIIVCTSIQGSSVNAFLTSAIKARYGIS